MPQITLHTGFYKIGQTDKIQSFCGVSNSLRHDPSSIWANMIPVLKDIKAKHSETEIIHFYSDGPTAQYRQKINFYLFGNIIYNLGFKGGSWNFHEAGHGKGIPDGFGISIKRSADKKSGFAPKS